jgi:hypothetical protein
MNGGTRAAIGAVAWAVLALPTVPDARHGAWAAMSNNTNVQGTAHHAAMNPCFR